MMGFFSQKNSSFQQERIRFGIIGTLALGKMVGVESI